MKRTLTMVLAVGLLTASCTDPLAPATPTPVTPTITETFSGTLLSLGSNTHTFTVQQVGGLKVTISDVSPASVVGLGIGTPSLVGCSVITDVKTVPGSPAELSGTASVIGPFCVSVFDTGALVEPVTYTVTVLHS